MKTNKSFLVVAAFSLFVLLFSLFQNFTGTGSDFIWTNYFGGDNGGPVSADTPATPLTGTRTFRISSPSLIITNQTIQPFDDSDPSWIATKTGIQNELSQGHDVVYLIRNFGQLFDNSMQYLTVTDPNSCQKNHAKCAAAFSSLQAWTIKQAQELLLLPGAIDHIYFEIGNEINSPCTGLAVEDYLNGESTQPTGPNLICVGHGPHDPNIIPLYAESVFAPEVAALLNNNPNTHIIMPSVAATYRTDVAAWVEALLDYQIQGDLIQDGTGKMQSLVQGKKISELVFALNHHYTVTGIAHTSKEVVSWETSLDTYLADIQTKGIPGLWATEELGARDGSPQGANNQGGEGAATVARLISQYSYFADKNNLNPTQLRALFWGWNLDPAPTTSGLFGFTKILKIIGPEYLKNLTAQSNLDSDVSEIHAFHAQGSRKIFIFIFPQNLWSTLDMSQWRITLKGDGIDLQKFNPHTSTINIFSVNGFSQPSSQVSITNSDLNFQLQTPISLGNDGQRSKQDVMLIELDPLPL